MRRPSPPSGVAEVLSRVLQRVDPEQQLRAYDIWTFWNDEVGTLIARRAQPAGFRDGVLFVSVATHGWMQELRMMKDTIRDRLNARLAANLVSDIHFDYGSVENEPEPAAAPVCELDEPALLSLPAIPDPTLAAAFTRVLRARAKRVAPARKRTSSRGTGKSR